MVNCSFVVDGCRRARKGLEPVIRAEVSKEFNERLAKANLMAKAAIWVEMEREISQRMEEKAPADSLY